MRAFAAAVLLADPLLHALAWQAILVGNALAALTMGLYFRRHHPRLRMLP